jgi:hypothetical protein
MKNFNHYKLLVISGSLIASQAIFAVPAQAIFGGMFGDAGNNLAGQWKEECQNKPGGCTENKVPEPMTILGVGAALASLPAFKKHYGKAKKEEIS